LALCHGSHIDLQRVRRHPDRRNEFDAQSAAFPREIQVRALRKLRQLDAAATIEDLRNPPGNRLELLKGKRAGPDEYKNQRRRICFRWVEKDAEDVEIVDYH
jgi:toxin HigB-1